MEAAVVLVVGAAAAAVTVLVVTYAIIMPFNGHFTKYLAVNFK